jgi:AcrR family transcriptional regulator
MSKKKKLNHTSDRILDCAETLFARQGYDGTSTRQISSEVGISIQTLHYHCETKLNLYNSVIERCIVPITKVINQHVEEMLKLDPSDYNALQERVGMVIDDVFDEFHQNPNYPLLLFRQWLEQDRELRRVEWDQLVPAIKLWAKKIEGTVDKSQDTGVDTQLLFLSLSWIYWGLFINPRFIGGLLGINPDSPEYIERLKRHAKEMTTRAMAPVARSGQGAG